LVSVDVEFTGALAAGARVVGLEATELGRGGAGGFASEVFLDLAHVRR